MASEKDTAIETVKIVNAPLETIVVPLKLIVADDQFNVRRHVDEGAYVKLRDDIKVNGLTNPLVVRRRDDGKYALIAGFTRFRALKEIEKEARASGGDDVPPVNVKVTVKEYTSEVEAHFDNVRDNMLRDALHPHDIAVKARLLRDDYGQKGPSIARGLGLDRDYCNNLMRALDRLEPRITEQWSKYHERATVSFLTTILTKEHDEQWERWLKQTGEWKDPEEGTGEEGDDENDDDVEEKPAKPTRPSVPTLESALEAVKKSDKPDEWKTAAVAALRFALGKAKKLADVYDPKKARAAQSGRKGKGAATADA